MMNLFLEHVLLKHPFENSTAYLVRLQLVRIELCELIHYTYDLSVSLSVCLSLVYLFAYLFTIVSQKRAHGQCTLLKAQRGQGVGRHS